MNSQNILDSIRLSQPERERPLITLFRSSGHFMRTIAGVVILAFVGLILGPSVVGVRTAMAADATEPVPSTAEGKLSKAMLKAQQRLASMEEKLTAGADDSQERADLEQLHQEITELDVSVKENFSQIKELLSAKNLESPRVFRRVYIWRG